MVCSVRMKRASPLLAVLCASLVVTISGCGDRTTAGPTASVTNGFHHRIRHTPGNLAKCRVQHPDVTTRHIGPAGGVIDVGPYTLAIPAGALERRVRIAARIRAGASVNVVEFKPDGLVFLKPATLSMSYANCEVDDSESLLRIAVVDNAFAVLDYLPSTINAPDQLVSGPVAHLTNYAVAW